MTKLFLSAVSSEFVSYRSLLANDLKRPNLNIAVQEDFGVLGRSTLEKVDTYIRHGAAMIHLIGKATGEVPEERAVTALLVLYPDLGTRLPPLAEQLRLPQTNQRDQESLIGESCVVRLLRPCHEHLELMQRAGCIKP